MKRATKQYPKPPKGDFISIHALMKRATKQYPKPPKGDFISIHALMKRATSFHCLYYNVPLYFNPRPHEEGDLKIGVKSNKIVISIHALMKRATQGVKQQILYYGISIHALVKRATDRAIAPQVIIRHFNPRPREEGDRILR